MSQPHHIRLNFVPASSGSISVTALSVCCPASSCLPRSLPFAGRAQFPLLLGWCGQSSHSSLLFCPPPVSFIGRRRLWHGPWTLASYAFNPGHSRKVMIELPE